MKPNDIHPPSADLSNKCQTKVQKRLHWQVPDSSEDNFTPVLCVADASEEFSPGKSGDMSGSKVAFFGFFIQFY